MRQGRYQMQILLDQLHIHFLVILRNQKREQIRIPHPASFENLDHGSQGAVDHEFGGEVIQTRLDATESILTKRDWVVGWISGVQKINERGSVGQWRHRNVVTENLVELISLDAQQSVSFQFVRHGHKTFTDVNKSC